VPLSLNIGFDWGRQHAVPPNNRTVVAEGEMGRSQEMWIVEFGLRSYGSRGLSPHLFWLRGVPAIKRARFCPSSLDFRLSTRLGRFVRHAQIN